MNSKESHKSFLKSQILEIDRLIELSSDHPLMIPALLERKREMEKHLQECVDDKRISWDELAINLAQVASERSEDPFRKVGACSMDFEHRVLGVAYNGLASGKNVDESFWKDRDERRMFMIHAEQNLMTLCKKGEAKIVAVTCLPCSSCATLLAAHGVKKVIYLEEYDRDQSSKKIFEFYGIELIKMKDLRDPITDSL